MEAQKISFKYNITLESEREYWKNKALNKWINYKTRCPNCDLQALRLKKI